MNPYEIRRFDEIESISAAGVNWRPIRRELGITAFGMNAYTGNTGDHVVEEHTEKTLGHEEVYVVVAGRATFTLGDEKVDVPAGAFVYVRDPETRRGAVAAEDGTTVLAIGGAPGAHEASGWEWSFAATPARERGDYEAALETVREGFGDRPGGIFLLYDAACYEALLGRRDDAIAHLREVLEAVPRLREHAARDEDFASLREDAEFLTITREPGVAGQGA